MIAKLGEQNKKLIFATTNSGYGVGEKDKFCTEETPLDPSRSTAPPNAKPKPPS